MTDTTSPTSGTEAPAAGAASEATRPVRVAPSAEEKRITTAIAINRGFGESLGRGLELALTIVVCGGIGWLIDRVVGTPPVFTIIFAVAGFAGIGVKLWLGYDLEMRKIDSEGVWNRTPDGTTAENRTPAPVDAPKQTVEL